jgi:hypothetical protein
LAFSWSPHFLEASAVTGIGKSDTKGRALCPANASGRRRDIEIGAVCCYRPLALMSSPSSLSTTMRPTYSSSVIVFSDH